MKLKKTNMKGKLNLNFLALVMYFVVFNFNAIAQDSIVFTWKGSTNEKSLGIKASIGKQFTIDWGDGSTIETKTGTGTDYLQPQWLKHTYQDTNNYTVKIIGSSADCQLAYFECGDEQVSSLDVSTCPFLKELRCNSNLLSNLNLSTNTNLTILDCRENQLNNLNLTANIALKRLYCNYNQLNSLNLSTNTVLEYLSCRQNKLKNLDLSTNTALTELLCSNNQLESLDLNTNMLLNYLQCYENRIPLSDLYASSQKISNQNRKYLGMQILAEQQVSVNTEIDFSTQKEFGGIATDFAIDKNGSPATENVDYTISNGIIKFKKAGNFVVFMTNSAIVSYPTKPASVAAEFKVTGNVGITDASLSNFAIYPNPADNNFFIDYDKSCTIKLYDMLGKEVLTQNSHGKTEIKISHLPNGIYNINIQSNGRTIGNSKIVKQ